MEKTYIPSPEVVSSDLSSFFPLFFVGLESSAQKAREYFPEEIKDHSLFSHLVRFEVKEYLKGAGFDCAERANTGVYFTVGKYPIIMLKADDGGIPIPRESAYKQAYYQQSHQMWLFPFPREIREHLEGPNLLLLWDVTEDGVLDEVQLACPKGGDITRESIETHWIVRVSHSAEMIPESQSSPSTDDGFDDFSDIRRIKRKLVGNGEEDE